MGYYNLLIRLTQADMQELNSHGTLLICEEFPNGEIINTLVIPPYLDPQDLAIMLKRQTRAREQK